MSDHDSALSDAHGTSFEVLLKGLRHGDETAWTTVFRELSPVVTGYLRGQRAPSPEDLTGEVFFNVVRDLHQFDGTEAQFRSWVFTIAHHRLIDKRRFNARRPADPTPTEDFVHLHDDDASVEDDAIEVLTTIEVGDLLGELTEEQRTALLLRLVGGLPLAEIGEIMGKRPGAVKQLQRRGLNALRTQLADTPYPFAGSAALSKVTGGGNAADRTNGHRPGRQVRRGATNASQNGQRSQNGQMPPSTALTSKAPKTDEPPTTAADSSTRS